MMSRCLKKRLEKKKSYIFANEASNIEKLDMFAYKQGLKLTAVMHLISVIILILMQALNWGKEMVAMSGSGPGYSQKVIITPYMHCLIFHVPVMMQRHGSLRHFSGQGML